MINIIGSTSTCLTCINRANCDLLSSNCRLNHHQNGDYTQLTFGTNSLSHIPMIYVIYYFDMNFVYSLALSHSIRYIHSLSCANPGQWQEWIVFPFFHFGPFNERVSSLAYRELCVFNDVWILPGGIVLIAAVKYRRVACTTALKWNRQFRGIKKFKKGIISFLNSFCVLFSAVWVVNESWEMSAWVNRTLTSSALSSV